MKPYPKACRTGFTLIELKIVIAIVAVLAVLITAGANRFIATGRKVQTMAQFRVW